MLTRWSLLLLSAFVGLLGSGLSASAEEWKSQSYPDDGFQVEFSGPVAVTETAMSEQTKSRIVRATNYLQEGGASAYFVAAMLMKESVNFDGGSADAFLANVRPRKRRRSRLPGLRRALKSWGRTASAMAVTSSNGFFSEANGSIRSRPFTPPTAARKPRVIS
jgi:hypothetical protein